MKFKKTYSFAFLLTFYLTLIVLVFGVGSYLLYDKLGILSVILLTVLLFLIFFFLIQYRVEHFIYRRVRKIYNDVSLLDLDDLQRKSVTTDMETLSKSLQKFAEGKRIEIQNLIEKDSFRRDFLGKCCSRIKNTLIYCSRVYFNLN